MPDGIVKVLFSQEQFTLPDCFFSVFRVNSRKGEKEASQPKESIQLIQTGTGKSFYCISFHDRSSHKTQKCPLSWGCLVSVGSKGCLPCSDEIPTCRVPYSPGVPAQAGYGVNGASPEEAMKVFQGLEPLWTQTGRAGGVHLERRLQGDLRASSRA